MTRAALLLLTLPLHAATEADVLVYGATPGGFCAAVAAAREGASVLLLEPTGHVGGVNTGGLCFSDSNQTVRSTMLGLFEEWHRRVEADYQRRGVELPYRVDVKDHSHWTYEPHVAARVTRELLAEAGVRVLPGHALTAVIKDGTRLTRLQTAQGEFTARVYVDATYEGDLMAAAGVRWTIGREGRAAYGESYAGRQYPKTPLAIHGLDASGQPLPLVTATEAGDETAGDGNVMVYSFRLCLTRDPANRVPFPAPDRYDPARFEVVRRYFAQEKRPHLLWDLYPLPGNKFDANNGIGKQFSMGLIGAGNGWSEADAAGRAAIWEAHRQYTLEFYHFLTTDPAVPENLRTDMASLGLCRDEFAEHGHWSPQLYVREGRRMVGVHVMTQQDILESPEKPDPVVVASFPIDSHDCRRLGTADRVVNEGTIFPVRMPGRRHGYPHHIPYRSLTPKSEECSNLLVPVALSSTHVALSSIRVEPTWMLLGQSAGIAAALSARRGDAVQDLPYPELRARLLAQRMALDLPTLPDLPPEPVSIDPATLPGLVLDDRQAELQGDWSHSANFKPHLGAGYRHDDRRGDGRSTAVFRFRAPKTGRHELRMAYSPHATRAARVPVTLTSGGQRFEFLADQTQPLPAGSLFRTLGTVDLATDGESTLTVDNRDTDGFVILDGFQLVALPE